MLAERLSELDKVGRLQIRTQIRTLKVNRLSPDYVRYLKRW